MTPRFFLDSADTDAWRRFKAEGWLHGATTNPTILEKAGLVSSIETARRLVTAAEELGLGELQVQSWGGAAELLVANGGALAALSGIVTVKIPATAEGFQAAARLKGEGCRVTLTACYTARQCAAAVALGLDYVAPYYGRMREAGLDADARLDAMKSIADPAGMRVLVASVRGGEQLETLVRRGFDTFTLAPAVAAALVTDADSDAAAAVFEAAAGRADPRARL